MESIFFCGGGLVNVVVNNYFRTRTQQRQVAWAASCLCDCLSKNYFETLQAGGALPPEKFVYVVGWQLFFVVLLSLKNIPDSIILLLSQ